MDTNTTIENKLRTYLRKTAKQRKDRVVTADDIHRFLNKNNLSLSSSDKTRLANVTLAYNAEFEPAGEYRSTRPEARGRAIVGWEYIG